MSENRSAGATAPVRWVVAPSDNATQRFEVLAASRAGAWLKALERLDDGDTLLVSPAPTR